MNLNDLASIFAVLTALATFGYFLLKKYYQKRQRKISHLVGFWSNEGDVLTEHLQTHHCEMEIKRDELSNNLIGTVNSTTVENGVYSGEISFYGKLNFSNELKIHLCDIKRGKKIEYGNAKIKLNNSKLFWTLCGNHNNVFPMSMIMFKVKGRKYFFF